MHVWGWQYSSASHDPWCPTEVEVIVVLTRIIATAWTLESSHSRWMSKGLPGLSPPQALSLRGHSCLPHRVVVTGEYIHGTKQNILVSHCSLVTVSALRVPRSQRDLSYTCIGPKTHQCSEVCSLTGGPAYVSTGLPYSIWGPKCYRYPVSLYISVFSVLLAFPSPSLSDFYSSLSAPSDSQGWGSLAHTTLSSPGMSLFTLCCLEPNITRLLGKEH